MLVEVTTGMLGDISTVIVRTRECDILTRTVAFLLYVPLHLLLAPRRVRFTHITIKPCFAVY